MSNLTALLRPKTISQGIPQIKPEHFRKQKLFFCDLQQFHYLKPLKSSGSD